MPVPSTYKASVKFLLASIISCLILLCRKSSGEKPPASAVVNVQLRNSLAMLRRCCNHPYLIEYPMNGNGQLRIDEQLVTSCGKLMLLDKMLYELKREGHKVCRLFLVVAIHINAKRVIKRCDSFGIYIMCVGNVGKQNCTSLS
jgi:hypothetical protein